MFVFGQSVVGRDLLAYRLGRGSTLIFVVGGIHTGFEANTVDLVEAMIDHYRRNAGEIQNGISFVFIPLLNPDGHTLGRVERGRFNAHQVDLNRNWGCNWTEEAYWREARVSAGAAPFSEPETAALAALINDLRPASVIFYHAAANGIFHGECEGQDADAATLAMRYGEVSGYPYGQPFDKYPVTGTASEWVASLGIPALEVELATADDIELSRNVRGLNAVQLWVLGR